jgi:hypothetical protein
MMARQQERKNISLEEKLNIQWDAEKYTGTWIALVKQLGLSVSAMNMIVKNVNG